MKKKFIKYITLALTLNIYFFTTIIPVEPQPRQSMCDKIVTLAFWGACLSCIVGGGINTYNTLTTTCPTVPEGFQPPAGTQVQIKVLHNGRITQQYPAYSAYNPETMEPPRYDRDIWGHCVLATRYK